MKLPCTVESVHCPACTSSHLLHLPCSLRTVAAAAAAADPLGGNSLCLLVGCLRQGDGSSGLHALTTLQHLAIAHAARNFPVINHGRWARMRRLWCHRPCLPRSYASVFRQFPAPLPLAAAAALHYTTQLA